MQTMFYEYRGNVSGTHSTGRGFEDHYDIQDQIGYGGFGVVYKAKLKGSDIVRAVKVIDKKDCDITLMENEVQSLLTLDHPHIVKLIRAYDTETHLNLVFELCEGPDLFDVLVEASTSKKRRMDEADVSVALRHMLKGMR